MGRKKRRPLDDDDILGGSLPPPTDSDDVGDGAGDPNDKVATATTSSPSLSSGGMDLSAIRTTMRTLLADHPDKNDDWLHRTIEKILKLKKKSLKNLEEELSDMRAELEEELDEEEAERERLEAEAEDEAKAAAGIEAAEAEEESEVDPDGGEEGSNEDDGATDDGGGGGEGTAASPDPPPPPAPLAGLASALLSLKPYSDPASPAYASSGSIARLVYTILLSLLSLLASAGTRKAVQDAWDAGAASRAAEADRLAEEDAAREAEMDDELRGTHLWCPNSERWVERGDAHGTDDDPESFPVTVCRDGARWVRWSKNLTTRTKKSASGEPMTKGMWMPIKVGEGWATAPDKAEIPAKQLADGDVRFFACLESQPEGGSNDNDKDSKGVRKKGTKKGGKKASAPTEVVDVTEWVTTALLTKESARALEVVDSGRVLFHMDLDAANEGKGVGGTAWVDDRYVDGEPVGGGKGASRSDKKARKKSYGR